MVKALLNTDNETSSHTTDVSSSSKKIAKIDDDHSDQMYQEAIRKRIATESDETILQRWKELKNSIKEKGNKLYEHSSLLEKQLYKKEARRIQIKTHAKNWRERTQQNHKESSDKQEKKIMTDLFKKI